MKEFAALITTLDQTTKTNVKTKALTEFFKTASDEDKLWTIALFSGRRPKRAVASPMLRVWAADEAGIPPWLFEECYPIVGDLAETIALVLPEAADTIDKPLHVWINDLQAIGAHSEEDKRAFVTQAWKGLSTAERFIFNKLITGGFRVGVSQKLVTRALAQATQQDEAELAHRLMGDWTPQSTDYHRLIEADDPEANISRPYPFCLAHSAPDDVTELGEPNDWHAEWKWDGIRGQIIRRGGKVFVWSRGEELITDRFPEFASLVDFVPDGTVLDGEVLAWRDDAPLSFAALQKRIGRKTVPKSLLRDAPVILYAYDLLEWQGRDIRARPFRERRDVLARLAQDLPADAPLKLSPSVDFKSWDDLAAHRNAAREAQSEGLMIKDRASPYVSGRKRGAWWKWKLDPLTIDAVMIYAQSGHGRRANLFTDYTFAVWNGNELVPFTKAYSGLTDEEFRKITAWVRKNTLQRFGPVRQVPAHHVFEIAFEGIQASTRHKSGVALRFPRMLRWRHDKQPADANTLDDLKDMLAQYG